MDSSLRTEPNTPLPTEDLGPLAWVHEELRKSLEAATKGLRRHLKDRQEAPPSDLASIDLAPLRQARQHFHQSAGALDLVGLSSAAPVLRAAEAVCARLLLKPQKFDQQAVLAIEAGCFAIQDYLDRVLAGRAVSALQLFPQYRALQELAMADRLHPSDLWAQSFDWRTLQWPVQALARAVDEALLGQAEQQVLVLLRSREVGSVASELMALCDGLAAGAQEPVRQSLWQLAAGFFELQAGGHLEPDLFAKRVSSRWLSDLKSLAKGQALAPDRLAKDMLFHLAHVQAWDEAQYPRATAVARAYGLKQADAIDWERPTLGRHDPAQIQQARKRVTAAKDAWQGVAGGEMLRLQSLHESFSLLNDSIRKLLPNGEPLARALTLAANETLTSGAVPEAELAMEVATSILFLEAMLEEGDLEAPEQAERVQRLAERVEHTLGGHASAPLEAWMEELYRRVSDRHTMGSVVQELRAALLETEKQLDGFFRDPAQRASLVNVPSQLNVMRGVLSVLGIDPGVQAVHAMREAVQSLQLEGNAPQDDEYRRQQLAHNLGALGFMIDMLSVQPKMVRALFVFDADSGRLQPVMGRQETEVPALVDIPVLVPAQQVPAPVAEALAPVAAEVPALQLPEAAPAVESVQPVVPAMAEAPKQVSPAAPAPVAAPVVSDLEDDDEMRQVFLEEAHEVFGEADAALAQLAQAPSDLPLITTVRRAFHTLKGSSRMVGLRKFGEAAWACERLYNSVLADQRPVDADHQEFSLFALGYLKEWVQALEGGDASGFEYQPIEQAAEAVREGRWQAREAAPEFLSTQPLTDAVDVMVAEEPGQQPFEPMLTLEPMADDELAPLPGVEAPAAAVEPTALEQAQAAPAPAEVPAEAFEAMDLAALVTSAEVVELDESSWPAEAADAVAPLPVPASELAALSALMDEAVAPVVESHGVEAALELPEVSLEVPAAVAELPESSAPEADAVDELALPELDLAVDAPVSSGVASSVELTELSVDDLPELLAAVPDLVAEPASLASLEADGAVEPLVVPSVSELAELPELADVADAVELGVSEPVSTDIGLTEQAPDTVSGVEEQVPEAATDAPSTVSSWASGLLPGVQAVPALVAAQAAADIPANVVANEPSDVQMATADDLHAAEDHEAQAQAASLDEAAAPAAGVQVLETVIDVPAQALGEVSQDMVQALADEPAAEVVVEVLAEPGADTVVDAESQPEAVAESVPVADQSDETHAALEVPAEEQLLDDTAEAVEPAPAGLSLHAESVDESVHEAGQPVSDAGEEVVVLESQSLGDDTLPTAGQLDGAAQEHPVEAQADADAGEQAVAEVTEAADVSVEPAEEEARRDNVIAWPGRTAAQGPAEPEPLPEPTAPDEEFKWVGSLRVSIPLFNIYLAEADELSRRLSTELSEWALELHRPVSDSTVAWAHSLAGCSGTVGFAELSNLARQLEHALERSAQRGHGVPDEASLFVDSAEEIRHLLHQFAAGLLKSPQAELLERLHAHDLLCAHQADLEAHSELETTAPAPSATVELVLPPVLEPVEASDALDVPVLDLPLQDTEGSVAEPVAELAEPVVELVEPVAELDEPVVELVEPVAELAEPVVELVEPVAELAEPVVELVEPVAELAEPVVALAAPAVTEAPAAVDLLPVGAVSFSTIVEPLVPTLGDEQRLPREVSLVEIEDDIDAVDAVDADLFPVFEEEAQELLPQLAAAIRAWSDAPNDHGQAHQAMRILHTFKGGARIAGAMRVGEVAHRLETAIEQRLAAADHASLDRHDIEPLQARVDVIQTWFEQLIQDDTQRYAAEQAQAEATAAVPLTAGSVMAEAAHTKALHAELSADPLPDLGELPTLDASLPQSVPASAPSAPAPASVDLADPVPAAAPVAGTSKALAVSQAGLQAVNWGRFERAPGTADLTPVQRAVNAQSSVRVRSQLLDRLVNQAGEVSITRARLESDMGQIKGSLRDLTDNLDRLRGQLRDIELQAETQITARMERAKAEGESFDPLEMDRFTRFQELTRMMAESVNDVGTVQRTLQRTLETAEDELAMQARLTRNLQDDLLRTRMSEFESLTERLYRVVRQASKETGKQVRLDLVGGGIEVDRGVLERMVGSFEHILRNSVTHGIESAEQRELLGKSPVGQITVSVAQEGNEVSVEFRDDGAGLNLARIREKAVAAGMLSADAQPTDGELAQFIFMPGFSTADRVSELAGRGVGMDVVRTEVNAMGGRIETASAPQRGTSFRLILPLTTAVTQVVMLRCGPLTIGVPATLVEVVRRAKPAELEAHYQSGSYTMGEQQLPFFWLGALLQSTPVGLETGRSLPVVVIRSANQRVAVHVDEVLGSQEVVVKNLGPQLSRLPGLAGMTLLASGAVALIYNPVALATVYGPQARGYSATALAAGWRVASGDLLQLESKAAAGQVPLLETQPELPLVLVVDDSLTVRRVTQRLLVREGYRVVLAKDGLDALEKLAQDLPHVVLSDIEMPRMDGFDLVRNIRGDERTKDLPVIMITSRIAQKHRDYAAELGVNHYLGKPYDEEHLLSLIAHFTQAQGAADGRA